VGLQYNIVPIVDDFYVICPLLKDLLQSIHNIHPDIVFTSDKNFFSWGLELSENAIKVCGLCGEFSIKVNP
jgi:hypothetical protein